VTQNNYYTVSSTPTEGNIRTVRPT